ncbi:MAG TPA: A24 family peptidase [Tepidisphaeraceae bacterium]
MSVSLAYLPLMILLGIAVVIDWRERRIPNWLNLLTFLSGLLAVGWGVLPVSPGGATIAIAIAIGLVLPRVLLGATGAGDLKQHIAVAVWMGPLGIFAVFLLATLAGMVMATAQAWRSGKIRALFQNSAVLAVNMVHVRSVGVDHIQRTGSAFRSIDKPLPYALPMFVSAALFIAMRTTWGV